MAVRKRLAGTVPVPILGTDWQPHLKGRALAERSHDPDTAAVHLDDLFGYGKTKPLAFVVLIRECRLSGVSRAPVEMPS